MRLAPSARARRNDRVGSIAGPPRRPLLYRVQSRLGLLDRDRRVVIDADIRLWIDPADEIGRQVYLNGMFEAADAARFAALLPAGGTVLDVGAHVGIYTLIAAKHVGPTGRVVAFEPNPATRRRLIANVDENRFANVSVRAEAVADREGTVEFYLQGRGTNSGVTGLRRLGADQRAIAVGCTTVDRAVEDAGTGRIDAIKVDVEGFEPAVIAGAAGTIAAHKPVILFEVNALAEHDGGWTAPSIALLRDLGYRLYGSTPTGLEQLREGDDPRRYRDPLLHDGYPPNLFAIA